MTIANYTKYKLKTRDFSRQKIQSSLHREAAVLISKSKLKQLNLDYSLSKLMPIVAALGEAELTYAYSHSVGKARLP